MPNFLDQGARLCIRQRGFQAPDGLGLADQRFVETNGGIRRMRAFVMEPGQ